MQDNGPGIVEQQLARIFGKLLYGSKFHKLSQSRGQQGMGISAAGMYAQLTTGKPMHVVSRVRGDEMARELFVSIDTSKNRPTHPLAKTDIKRAQDAISNDPFLHHTQRGSRPSSNCCRWAFAPSNSRLPNGD